LTHWHALGDSRRQVVPALVAVLALHALLFAVLSRSWTRPLTVSAATRVTLRLIPALAADRQRPPPGAEPRAAPAVTRASPRHTTTLAPASTRDASPLDAATAIHAPSDSAGAPAPPASQPPRQLDLSLPRGWATRPGARHPAIDDPRTNTARLTPEQRMAGAFDTQVIEEPMEDGRRRIRRGADCVIVVPSRIAQLMPFNEAAARTPSQVTACP